MKKFLLFTFVFILPTLLIYPQWVNQNPVPDGNDLWSTFFVDDNTGWIVGSDGFIKKTTNAGLDWIEQNSGTTLILKSVHFVDQNTGWICGETGLILNTTDGGINWDSLSTGTTAHLTDIHFYDADTGYVVGYNGTILKTTDGGSVWTSLISGTTNHLYSMDFVDAFIGYAVGEVNDTSSLIKTTDGGASWIDKSSGLPDLGGYSMAVDFIDANTGFIGGYWNSLYKTTDGGDTWISSGFALPLKQKERNPKDQLSPYPQYFFDRGVTSIYFKDANNGWYLNWGDPTAYIYGTTDGGITWQQEYIDYSPYNYTFLSVFVTQNGTGLAVGAKGIICLKEDSSSDWLQLFSGTRDRMYSVYFINENIGWASTVRRSNPNEAVILNTTNGGKKWKTQRVTGFMAPMVCFYFINEIIGWAVNGDGGSVLLTTDGGNNWTQVNDSPFKNNNLLTLDEASLFFIDENIGWYTGSEYSNSWIRKSTDGGNTWTQKSSTGGSSIFFIDQNIGWVVGDNGLFKSTDGGETWVQKSASGGSCVRFNDSNIGMCVGGGAVLVSTDGGETWTSKSGPPLQSINFINSTTVWGYSSEGTVYKTFDFGDNWISLNVGLGYGNTSFFINEYTGWVVGGDYYIFKYQTEPQSPPTWSNQINIEDAGGTKSSGVLTFGQHPDATDSIDALLGEYELPPPPFTGNFDSRFNLPTNPQVSSLIDYRDSVETDIIWNMTFQPGSAGYPMTFSWDSTSFPEGTFYLKDRIDGSFVFVNMKNQNSYVLTEPTITSLNIIYRGICDVVSVNNEWNMISVPLLAEDMSLSNLFPTATSLAYGYDNGYVMEDTLVEGVGYWLKFGANEDVQICGALLGDTIQVEEGWNMFGVYEEDILVSQLTTTPPGIIATYFFGFEDGYNLVDTLKSGKGYWVRVTEDGVINLNGGALSKDGEQEQIAKIDQDWGRMKITDNEGKGITLYASEEEIESDFYELPPIPPTGIFDARYGSGRLVESLTSEKTVQISSDKYPITIKAEGISITVTDRINGKLLNKELTSGEEIRITNNKITSVKVTGKVTKGLPVSYELYQNYPNPFNPSTTIKFAVSEESNVNLSIYNVLGELVSTLVNEQMKPGFYEYELNASNLASGVYLYRLLAGSFVETKKMVLTK